MRRFTWLANASSKKLANHEVAIALDYMDYNFVRTHQTRRVTPAMQAAVSGQILSIAEVIASLN